MVKFTKVVATKMLGDVSHDKQFWCSDGRVLRSLLELGAALKEMSGKTSATEGNE